MADKRNDKRKVYFIALIPPEPLYQEALQWKVYFKEKYNSKASLNSPPHITLHMPFEWNQDKEEKLVTHLSNFAATQKPVPIQCNNFNCFSPRVIFIDVVPSKELADLQLQLTRYCKQHLNLFHATHRDNPFHPHLTLAFRDLKKPLFHEAWNEFKNKQFNNSFLAEALSLLKHNGKNWVVLHQFKLH